MEKFVQFLYKDLEGPEITYGYQLSNNMGKTPYIIQQEILIKSRNLPINTLFFNLGTFPATPGDTDG
jgi:hypothetical protein